MPVPELKGPFRVMCKVCGHTSDNKNLTEACNTISHAAGCNHHIGASYGIDAIDLAMIKPGNPRYFQPFNG